MASPAWAWRDDFSAAQARPSASRSCARLLLTRHGALAPRLHVAQRPWPSAGGSDDPVPLDQLLLRRDGRGTCQRGLGFLSHDDRGDVAAARRARALAERRAADHVARNRAAVTAASRAAAAARLLAQDCAPPRPTTPGPRLGPGLPPPAAAQTDIVSRNAEMAAYAPRRSASRLSTTSSFGATSRPASAASCWGAALAPPSERCSGAAPPSARHSSYGRAPAYLARFAAQRAAEDEAARAAAAAAAEQAAVPPGMRSVAASERQAALALLDAARVEASEALRSLPLATNTPYRVRRRDAAEARLAEIDAAIALFTHPTVYLPAATPSVEAASHGEGGDGARAQQPPWVDDEEEELLESSVDDATQ